MFKARERMAMVVNRWSTIPAIKRQNIAEHSFYVALYTDFLCKLLKWPHPRRYLAIHWALIHDMPETVTSDIPGPVKRTITSKAALRNLEDRLFQEFEEGYGHDPSDRNVALVVKAANLIDEVFYLHSERLLGNQFLDHVFANSWRRLVKALTAVDLPQAIGTIKLELEEMKRGVVGLINDDDDLE